MKSNRVLTLAVLLGVVILAVTFLGAARMTGDDGKTKDTQKILSPVKSGSKGVVVFGTGDIDNGGGLQSLYPESFPQPSKVIKIADNAREGSEVKKGDILVELDPQLTDLKIEEAKAGLDKARAAVKAAEDMYKQTVEGESIQKTGAAAQRLLIESKQDNLKAAEKDLQHKKEQLEKLNATNDPEVQAAVLKLEAAQKELNAERKKLETVDNFRLLNLKQGEASANLAMAKAAVAVQDAVLKQAEYARKLLNIKAPADGRIIRNSVTEGAILGPQTRQAPIVFLAKGPIIVRAEVDQEFASRVYRGQDAVIQDEGNSNLKWTGKVIRVADCFLPKRSGPIGPDGMLLNDTRVLECIVSVEGGDASVPVRVGQRVKVSIGVE